MNIENRNIEKHWELEIPYNNTTGRKNAKKIGATWNPDEKVWEVVTTEYKLDCRNLWKFVKQEKFTHAKPGDNKIVDYGAGFAMENTAHNRAIVNRYGFDAIEKI